MTTDKYQPRHECPLEERVRGIEADVGRIKAIAIGAYEKLGELIDTADEIYAAVSYLPASTSQPDADWDFADEEE